MCDEKLRSDEVPEKFAHWLLSMGCPTEKVPSIEKIAQMCRGHYYMVWRSLIEHVEAKNIIRQKRLQVFCDDVKLCKEKNVFNEHTTNAAVPEQLKVWQEYQALKERVSDAESTVEQARSSLNELIDKISCKVTQRNSSRKRIEDLRRRVCLLRQVSNELTAKKANLEETKSIANSLCNVESDQDIQSKLDKCLALVSPNQRALIKLSNPIASSSIVSTHETEGNNEKEEMIMSLSTCRGDALWPLLYEKRSAIVAKISLVNAKPTPEVDNGTTPNSVLAHTAALHTNLALDVMKNKIHIKQTHSRFAAAVEDLNNYISGEACELLVLRCERAKLEARVKALKNILEEITNCSGVFHADGENVDAKQATHKKIADIDKCIVNTRDEIKSLIVALATTERKIANVKDYLVAVFNAFHDDTPVPDNERFRGVNLDFPQESISLLRQFYTERCERSRDKNLSLDLDLSETSFHEAVAEPRFVDELKVYLKKFNLEKNRKLVLDSGEKIWIFETLNNLMSKLNTNWINNDLTPILCPSLHISSSVKQLTYIVQEKCILMDILKGLNRKEASSFDLDISSKIQHEADIVDKIKKRISENLILLQKINKNLGLSQDNLEFWAKDEMKKYISSNRTVDGKTYREYEAVYLQNIELKS